MSDSQNFAARLSVARQRARQTFILEPILTPSAGPIDFDGETPLDPSETFAEIDLIESAVEHGFVDKIDPNVHTGTFIVGDSGEIEVDFLFDGGFYSGGEIGLFSLEGIDAEPGSSEFSRVAASRALSNSELGHVIISDPTDAAKFSGSLREGDFNAGEYKGLHTVEMRSGDRIGIIFAPNHTMEEVQGGKTWNVMFSMAEANLEQNQQFGQLNGVPGEASTYVFEDLHLSGRSDRDYNDMIFSLRGAEPENDMPGLDALLPEEEWDWRESEIGQDILGYVTDYVPEDWEPIVTVSDRFLNPNENFELIGRVDNLDDIQNIEILWRDPFADNWQNISVIDEFDADGSFSFEHQPSLKPGHYEYKTITNYASGLTATSDIQDVTVLSLEDGVELSDRVKVALDRATQLSSYTPEQLAQTPDWLVSIQAGEDATAIAESLGLQNLGPSGHLPNTYLWSGFDGQDLEALLAAFDTLAPIEFAYPMAMQKIELHNPWQEPLVQNGAQWHLLQGGVKTVWDEEQLDGSGVQVGVVDIGFNVADPTRNLSTHTDLADNYRADLSRDFDENDDYSSRVITHTLTFPDGPHPIFDTHEIDDWTGYNRFTLPESFIHGKVEQLKLNFEITDYVENDLDVYLVAPEKYPGQPLTERRYRLFQDIGSETYRTEPDYFHGWPARGDWSLEILETNDNSEDAVGLLQNLTLEITTQNDHGTNVAGVVAASGSNNQGGSGVASGAQWAALRVGANGINPDKAADALSHRADTPEDIDIYQNSWGLSAFYSTFADAEFAIETNTQAHDSIYVFSAGNNRALGGRVDYNGFANARHTIAVGAVARDGQAADYSASGSALLISAYSSDQLPPDGSNDITTTDSDNQYTDAFGGTSAAAPFVSGVVALMLEANPSLNWRDVQHILIQSADRTGLSATDWTPDPGSGIQHSYRYGFGLIDPLAAVQLAKTWQPLPQEQSVKKQKAVARVIEDYDNNIERPLESTIKIDQELTVESVEVIFEGRHHYRGDLEMILTSPSGEESVLSVQNGRIPEVNPFYGDSTHKWTFTSLRHFGEAAQGDWTLKVVDKYDDWTADQGFWTRWKLNVYGTDSNNTAPTATPLDQTYTYIEDQPLTLTPIAVADADGDNLSVILSLSDAAAGTLTGGGVSSNAAGIWEFSGTAAEVTDALANLQFIPEDDFNGDLTITTEVSDGKIATPLTGLIELTGTPVNDVPELSSGTLAQAGVVGEPLEISYDDLMVATGAQDVDGDTITVTIAAAASGSIGNLPVTLGPGESFTWTPESEGSVAAFEVVASDGTDDATPVVVSAVVNAASTPINTAPTMNAVAMTFTGAVEQQPYTITYDELVAATGATDAEGDTIQFQIPSISNGTLTLNGEPVVPGITVIEPGDELVWIPDAAGDGQTAFTVQATDGSEVSDPVNVTFDVAPEQQATFLTPDQPYLSFEDSPFKDEPFSTFYLENFEDGQLNTPGVSVSEGYILNPSSGTDSVDADDGQIDGNGSGGREWYNPFSSELTINFGAQELGQLPTHAGFALTDIGVSNITGQYVGNVTLEAFDANGLSLGTQTFENFGDNSPFGGTNEDRFFGVQYDEGISSLKISRDDGTTGIEIDHIQYGFLNPLIVTNTNDSGIGSLRYAIEAANANPGADPITFNIPTSDPGYNASTGTFTIRPLSELPEISDATLLDATSQPGFTDKPIIELDGSLAGDDSYGLNLSASDSTIRGFVINRFNAIDHLATVDKAAIRFAGDNNMIVGNYIGTDVTGKLDFGNSGNGILGWGTDNIIGGTTAQDHNLISGNDGLGVYLHGNNQQVLGNYIGTDIDGTEDLGNGFGLRFHNVENGLIQNNLVSGNDYDGIWLDSNSVLTGNKVFGNKVGTDITGTQVIANDRDGITLHGRIGETIIGGAELADRNLISGNGRFGIRLNTHTTNSDVLGNYIGTDSTGTLNLGNASDGIRMYGTGDEVVGNTILNNGSDGIQVMNSQNEITRNTIADNQGSGIFMEYGSQNTFSENVIHDNVGLGIDLAESNASNDSQVAPTLSSAQTSGGTTIVTGAISETPNTTYMLEFFSNPDNDGEGQTFIGSQQVTTNAAGNANFTANLPGTAVGQFLTATATDADENTSEFSSAIEVIEVAAPEPVTQDITVTIHRIREIDNVDRLNDADFRATVRINGQTVVSPVWEEDNDVNPNWKATQRVTATTIPITINVEDDDGWRYQEIDVDPTGGNTLTVEYNLLTGEITGPGINGQPGEQLFAQGNDNGSDDDAQIWFSIDANTPPTLSQVAPLGNAFQAQPLIITHADLLNGSDAQDADGNPIAFTINRLGSGSLAKGGFAVTPGTVLAPGEAMVWVPDAAGNGIEAFSVTATDGISNSETPIPVTANVGVGTVPSGELTVTINRIREIDNLDWFNDADFRATVYIDGQQSQSPVWGERNDVSPNWQANHQVTGTTIPITVQIHDKDDEPGGRNYEEVDVNPTSGHTLVLEYNTITGEVTGPGINGQTGELLFSRGNGDGFEADAELGFSIDFTPTEQIPTNHWHASFINRTEATVSDRATYDFSNPVATLDLGAQAANGKLSLYHEEMNGLDYNIQPDNYAMQAWTRTSFEAGQLYKVTTQSDNGVWFRLRDPATGQWLDESIVEGGDGADWRDRNAYEAPRTIFFKVPATGEYDFYVDYYDKFSSSVVDFTVEEAQVFQDAVNPQAQWSSEVYWWDRKLGNQPPADLFANGGDASDQIGTLNLGSNIRSSDGKAGMTFDWSDAAVQNDVRLPDNNYAILATTQASLEAGRNYQMRVRGDDGFQLLARNRATGQEVFITPENQWQQAYGAHQVVEFSVPSDGQYDIEAQFYEERGDAYFDLAWEPVNFGGQVISTINSNLRAGPSTHYSIVGSVGPGANLTFDKWTTGEFIDYIDELGTASNQWYRLAGSDRWISAALINGQP
ncbi:MAG: S8 family serine peptidase [Cyanobacteria bacterium P01_G01_bin.54]